MLRFLVSLSLLLLALTRCEASARAVITCAGAVPMRRRYEVVTIKDFGGVGDGKTLNTKAFREAIYRIEHLRRMGGTLLYIPRGIWLTGSFNLTSHMTLYLAKDAVLRATQDTWNWPLIDPLPSYGRGRERPGGRYMSFIHGNGLEDVIITGDKGTIDGQGYVWWNMWRSGSLKYTRPSLIEFMYSKDIIISNVVLQNSPFWNIHPVYCSNVVVRFLSILAPFDSPNTDGIDPDSSYNVCIEDCYIATGDDMVALKSGWDEYGISYGRPSYGITIRRLRGSTPFAGIAIGSETSGGIQNVLVEDVGLVNTGIGIHLKTSIGRGGIIRNITVADVVMNKVQTGIKIASDVDDHPDHSFNPGALPVVDGITFRNVWGVNVEEAGSMQGLRNSPFTRICLWNVNFGGVHPGMPWKCSHVSGTALGVHPWPCPQLNRKHGTSFCSVPT